MSVPGSSDDASTISSVSAQKSPRRTGSTVSSTSQETSMMRLLRVRYGVALEEEFRWHIKLPVWRIRHVDTDLVVRDLVHYADGSSRQVLVERSWHEVAHTSSDAAGRTVGSSSVALGALRRTESMPPMQAR